MAKSLEYHFENKIMHVVYSGEMNIKHPKYKEYSEIVSLADEYEGKIENRIGMNLPLKKENKKHEKYRVNNAEYLIMYKKGDILTKKHELQHARYYLDQSYRDEIKKTWEGLSESSKRKVLDMLKKMKYPDNIEILIDEFQAYLFTEKPNFFGKLL